MQYLYLFKCKEYYKIGFTVDVPGRLAQLYTGNPFNIDVVFVYEFPDAESVERVLHQRFKNKRGRGEWFLLENNDTEIIGSICSDIGGNLIDFSMAQSDTSDDYSGSLGWRGARKMMDADEVYKIANGTIDWISETYSLSERTASNWRGYAKREFE